MEQNIDQAAFYMISGLICMLTLLTKILGHKKALVVLSSIVVVTLFAFLLFGIVVKDIHGVNLPMKEISIIFFGLLKALFPMLWLVGLVNLISIGNRDKSLKS